MPAVQQQNSPPTSAEAQRRAALAQKYLTNCRSLYSCIYCRTHLANHDELVSRSFQGNRSRAYLFNSVINVSCGPAVQRELNTGSHAVADIFCANCQTTIGWKYEKAFVETQKYKEGKYIIELAHVVRENRHLEFDKRDMLFGLASASDTKLATAETDASSKQQAQARRRKSWRNSSLRDASLSPGSSGGDSWSSPSTSASSSNEDEPIYRRSRGQNGHDGCPVATVAAASANGNDGLGGGGDDDDDDDDEDEEFMFPLYDDLMCSHQSSFTSASAITRLSHNKTRRSLYSESTPYDWKYSTAPTLSVDIPQPGSSARIACISGNSPADDARLEASSASPGEDERHRGTRATLAPSFSDEPSPSTSSSASSASSGAFDTQKTTTLSGDETDYHRDDRNGTAARNSEHETQFKFDIEDSSPPRGASESSMQRASSSSRSEDLGSSKQHSSGLPDELGEASGGSSSIGHGGGDDGDDDDARSLVSARSREFAASKSQTNSLSMDDEQFYDCNTEHEVQQFQCA